MRRAQDDPASGVGRYRNKSPFPSMRPRMWVRSFAIVKEKAMSRLSTALNIVLAAVVIAQGWVLIRRENGEADAAIAQQAKVERSPRPESIASLDSTAIADQLSRIDARLAALEHAPPDAERAQQASKERFPVNAQAAQAADRRLVSMIAGKDIDHETMLRFQASLAALPPEEQAAMTNAFSRALNEDRIRLRF
jgi:hypothetical protein